jgi:hypothetical protein
MALLHAVVLRGYQFQTCLVVALQLRLVFYCFPTPSLCWFVLIIWGYACGGFCCLIYHYHCYHYYLSFIIIMSWGRVLSLPNWALGAFSLFSRGGASFLWFISCLMSLLFHQPRKWHQLHTVAPLYLKCKQVLPLEIWASCKSSRAQSRDPVNGWMSDGNFRNQRSDARGHLVSKHWGRTPAPLGLNSWGTRSFWPEVVGQKVLRQMFTGAYFHFWGSKFWGRTGDASKSTRGSMGKIPRRS